MLWQSVSSSKHFEGKYIFNSKGTDSSENNDKKVPEQTVLHWCWFRQQVFCCKQSEESSHWWGRRKSLCLTVLCIMFLYLQQGNDNLCYYLFHIYTDMKDTSQLFTICCLRHEKKIEWKYLHKQIENKPSAHAYIPYCMWHMTYDVQ